MIATAPAEHYRRAIPLLLADPAIDSLLTIFIPPLVTNSADVARAIADTARESSKPVLATFFGAAGVPDLLAPVPCYVFPESAARALAHAASYAEWRQRPPAQPFTFSDDQAAALRREVASPAVTKGGWLSPIAATSLLEAAGIPIVPTRLVASELQAVSAARELGFPVVLKGVGPDIVHKTEAHAVFTHLEDESDVTRTYAALSARTDVRQVFVQPMAAPGVEMMVGGTLDPLFGHVVVCGSGGTLVELMRDITLRLAPLTPPGAHDMLQEVRGAALLRGFRGAPPRNEAALLDVVLRVGALLDACPEIVELDLNPVIVSQTAAVVVDARIRVAGSS